MQHRVAGGFGTGQDSQAADRACAPPAPRALLRGERALHVEGDLAAARRWFDAAYDIAERAADAPAMARAAVGMGGLWVYERRLASEVADVEARQRHALALVGQSSLGLRLRARLAAEADYRLAGHEGIAGVLEQIRTAGDPLPLAEALSLAHHCHLGPESAQTRASLAEELLLVGARTGRRIDTLMGLTWRVVDGYLAADPAADRSLEEMRGLLACRPHAALDFVMASIDVMLAIRSGRLEAAEEAVARACRLGHRAGDADAPSWAAAQLVTIRWFQARSGELAGELDGLSRSPQTGAVDRASYAALAVALAGVGERNRAACALARVRGDGFAHLGRWSGWLVAMGAAIEAAHLLGDRPTAHDAYAVLTPFAHLPMSVSLAVACLGSTQHALGTAALTVGDVDRAVAHFEAAVQANLAIGHLPAAVLSRHRLGSALELTGRASDADRARGELARARETAAAMGVGLPPRPLRAVVTLVPAHSADSPIAEGAPGAPTRPLRSERSTLSVTRRGDGRWQVRLGARCADVGDCLGLRYLAILAARPGQQIDATELALAVAQTGPVALAPASRQTVLDTRACQSYRERLAQLAEAEHECESSADDSGARAARAERAWLVRELAHAAGPGGRQRHFVTDPERARIAVSKAIRRGLERIADADPVLAARLRERVRTGTRCCLADDDETAWDGTEWNGRVTP